MAAFRGKRAALLIGVAGILALVVGIAASWSRLREEWYIWRLSSDDEAARNEAAYGLGELRCVRALPVLFRTATERDWPHVIRFRLLSNNPRVEGISMDPLSYAIYKIGPLDLPMLTRASPESPAFGAIIELIEASPRRQMHVTCELSR